MNVSHLRNFQILVTKSVLTGLWRKDFPHCLLWEADSIFTVSKTYNAPSWSWAAYDWVNNAADSETIPCGRSECKLINCYVQPAIESNPYGQVRSGSLEIEAWIQKFDLAIHGSKDFDCKQSFPRHLFRNWRNAVEWLRPRCYRYDCSKINT